MTSQGGLKISPLYSFINEIITFFMITKQRANISSLNFLCICIIRYEYIFMTSLMTSPGHKIGQILKLIYLRQYLNYSVDQKHKMSEMLMAIFLVYSHSGITYGKKVCRELKKAAIFKFWNIKHSFNLTSDMKRSSQIMQKKYFHDDDVIDDVTGWPQIRPSIFRQYLSYSVNQKLKMSEMLMAIFLIYSTSDITSGKKSLSGLKWRPFWKFWNIKHSFNLTSDMKRSSPIMPKSFFFMVMTSSMTSQGGLKVSLYIHV